MNAELNRRWLLAARPQDMIRETDFRWSEEPRPVAGDGQVLVRNLWLSFDPTQRNWMARDTYVPAVPLGAAMYALAVGQVVASRRPEFAAGDLVQGMFGWQDYIATDGSGLTAMRRLPPGVAPNLALSLLGVTGFSAYFGVTDIGRPQAGETFVVSGAAGAVGSVAGQIAKILGCRVIGIAGGRAKCDWLVGAAGFDGAIDYRAEKIGDRLGELCPDGIDVYFDNVGGDALTAVLGRLRRKARIVLCGAISRYNDTTPQPGPPNYANLIGARARMEGFLIFDYAARYGEAAEALAGWLRAGRLQQKEDVAVGLEHAPRTLMRLFTGENFGKQLLKIADQA